MNDASVVASPADGSAARKLILGSVALCLFMLFATARAQPSCESFDPSDEAGVSYLWEQASSLSPEEVQHYQEIFKACLAAGEAGSANAAYRLGWMYFAGIGTERDGHRAAVWLHRAEQRESGEAAFMLAVLYSSGMGVAKNDERARSLFLKAARAGNPMAQTRMGHYYSEEGEQQDLREAHRWYKSAAEQGRRIAQVELGLMYRDGRGVARNAEEAFRWFLQAAEAGEPYAQLLVATAYHRGRGVAVDEDAAIGWALRGALQGDAACQYLLGGLLSMQPRIESQIRAYAWLNLAVAAGMENAAELRDSLELILSEEHIATAGRLSSSFVPREDAREAYQAPEGDVFDLAPR